MNRSPERIRCAVVGGSGYVGGELVRLLLGHPKRDLVAVTANDAAGRSLAEVHPNLAGVDVTLRSLSDVGDAEVLFLALPNGETMHVVEGLPDRMLVDTSADFRLRDAAEYAGLLQEGPRVLRARRGVHLRPSGAVSAIGSRGASHRVARLLRDGDDPRALPARRRGPRRRSRRQRGDGLVGLGGAAEGEGAPPVPRRQLLRLRDLHPPAHARDPPGARRRDRARGRPRLPAALGAVRAGDLRDRRPAARARGLAIGARGDLRRALRRGALRADSSRARRT
jgi:hypothetical protein